MSEHRLATINILTTLQCDYRCAHCMMRAGPHRSSAVVSYDDMAGIIDFAEQLEAVGISAGFNFVGGEPTLYPDALEMALRMVHNRLPEVSVEMTTNGGWLADSGRFLRFASWIRQGLFTRAVRISSSKYHDAHRTPRLQRILRSTDALRGYLEDSPVELYESGLDGAWCARRVECETCGAAVTYDDRYKGACRSCGEARSDVDDELSRFENSFEVARLYDAAHAILEAIGDGALYVDRQFDGGGSPHAAGRAIDTQAGADFEANCFVDTPIFSFGPGARLRDVCCLGGPASLGRASDGLALLARRDLLMDALDRKGRLADKCAACRVMAKKFAPGGPFDSKVKRMAEEYQVQELL